ncbi:hypothetical protein ELAC_2058 [Estrella lausannensis]|uniref:Uncharacterized protein n=1 Tax=Estrella lausannensis TaxID=483423 RepID=A0A0H5DU05_9BACT|nr:hypothetical protein ELAC_2058 [Estrella lausannensis]
MQLFTIQDKLNRKITIESETTTPFQSSLSKECIRSAQASQGPIPKQLEELAFGFVGFT